MGGEHSEEYYNNLIQDARNRKYIDPWRSDVVFDAASRYNETNAISEVS